MSILTLLNAKPTPKTKPKRSKPTPRLFGLPRYNRIASWVKFVHPPIGDQARPEGRGKSVPATCEYATPDMPMDSIGCKVQPEARYVFVEGSGYQLAEPQPEPVVEQPTKAQYIQAFQAELWEPKTTLPRHIMAYWVAALDKITPYLELDDRQPPRLFSEPQPKTTWPRSARRALDQYRLLDLSCAYDRPLIARIVYYCEHHKARAYASKHLTN